MVERDRQPPLATFAAHEPLVSGSTTTLGEDQAQHMRVRRLDPGATVRLVDGQGGRATGVLRRLTRNSAHVEVGAVEQVTAPPALHLLAPVADKERMLWLAEKATELGIASWRPVVWRRSRSVTPRGEGAAFMARVRARMLSALEQSGCAWLPSAFPDTTIERALAAAPEGDRLLLAQDGEPILARPLTAPLVIAVGPEGGMEPDERARFEEAGFRTVSIGATILRFETAALAALAVARAAAVAEHPSPAEHADG